jgi:hypothetical protein
MKKKSPIDREEIEEKRKRKRKTSKGVRTKEKDQ